MTFLIDSHLPRALRRWLADRGHRGIHTSELPAGASTPDSVLWRQARAEGWVIVSKHDDFRQQVLRHGPPPPVVLVALGNCSNASLLGALTSRWPAIEQGLLNGAWLIVVEREEVTVFNA